MKAVNIIKCSKSVKIYLPNMLNNCKSVHIKQMLTFFNQLSIHED